MATIISNSPKDYLARKRVLPDTTLGPVYVPGVSQPLTKPVRPLNSLLCPETPGNKTLTKEDTWEDCQPPSV